MGLDVVITYERIEQLPAEIRQIYAEFHKKIRPESDLHRYIEVCENIVEKIKSLTQSERLEVHNAQRVLLAIVDCYQLLTAEERSAFKGLIAQIEASPLAPKESEAFHGLNAVFELEYLQYLRHRKIQARLGEPDIVVSTEQGNYYIACKSINSLKNIEGNLEKATSQIAKKGVGFVALNFEPHVYCDEVVTTHNPSLVMAALNKNANDLYKDYEGIFDSKLAAGCFDGITIQICCVADVVGEETHLNTFTHNIYYARSNDQPQAAVERFKSFRSALKGSFFL